MNADLVKQFKSLPVITDHQADVCVEEMPTFSLVIIQLHEHIPFAEVERMKRSVEGLVGETVKVLVSSKGSTVRVEHGIARVEMP